MKSVRSTKSILITGAGGPIGVNVTRSLRAAPEGLRLLGTDCDPYHLPLALTDTVHLIPPARQTEAYLDALCKLIKRQSIDLLLPTHPVEVRTLSVHRQTLQTAGATLFLPEHETILAAQDKWATNRCLAAAGIAVPRTFKIDREADLVACFDALQTRPIWVRGSGVPGAGVGVASLPCRELVHASAWVDYWQGWGKFIASEYLPGRNLTWCGLFADNRLVACQSRERLAYVLPHVSPSGITGAPAVSKTIRDAELRQIGEQAVRQLCGERAHGVFFVDFKGNATNQPQVTEINAGRFGTTIHFYTEAGFNFPYLLVRLALGEDAPLQPWVDPIAPETYWLRTLDCGPALVRDLEAPSSP